MYAPSRTLLARLRLESRYSEDQPRDELGRFGEGGGGGSAVSVRESLAEASTTEEISAAFAQEASDISGRTVRVDMAGSDPQIAREHAEGILRCMERYPDVWVAQVVTYGPGGARPDLFDAPSEAAAYAVTAEMAPTADGFGYVPTIGFNAEYASDPNRYRSSLDEAEKAGWTVAGGPMSTAAHEFGHVLTNEERGKTAVAGVAREQARGADEKPSAYIRSQVSDYATTNADELAAEAFADVVMRGDGASDLSQAIVGELDSRYQRRGA